jgi:NAD(P)H-hydrate epimerase
MRPVLSAAASRARDQEAISLGIPGVALMELASRGVAEVIHTRHRDAASRGVWVVCGSGNNGGDGYGVARWLTGWGYEVRICALSEGSTGDAALMRSVCEQMGIGFAERWDEAGLIVDACLGTGLKRDVTGELSERLRALARHPAEVVAVDIPSGLCADTGTIRGVCVPAARTVTFGTLKFGHLGEPGTDLCGPVEVVDIGLDALGAPVDPWAEVPDSDDLQWPRRAAADHKSTSGHLLVIAGSRAMSGAAVLTCRAALAAGAGLVTLLAPRNARLERLPSEVMLMDGGDGDVSTRVPSACERFHAVAAGPGLGGGHALPASLLDGLKGLWAGSRPAVFDADALVAAVGEGRGARVITPHAGEAARLLSIDVGEVLADRRAAALALARGRTAVLKGRNSLVASPERPVSVNPTGGPILATAGSGDVLCGVVGALLARGLSGHEAARLAVWVHGAAGDLLGEIRGQGWTAGDVASALPKAIDRL